MSTRRYTILERGCGWSFFWVGVFTDFMGRKGNYNNSSSKRNGKKVHGRYVHRIGEIFQYIVGFLHLGGNFSQWNCLDRYSSYCSII